MARQQVSGVAGWYALRPLAKELGTSYHALWEYCKRHRVNTIQVGRTVMVELSSLRDYRVKLGALLEFEPCVS